MKVEEEKNQIVIYQNEGSKHNNDLLHGITLEKVIETLVQRIGWQKMGESVNIKCFTDKPNVRSSLHFLRRMPWAREKVEQLYIETLTIDKV